MPFSVSPMSWAIPFARPSSERIDHPRVRAHEVVDERRDDHERDQRVLAPPAEARDVVRDRIADQQAQRDRRQRVADRAHQDRHEHRVEGPRVVLRIPAVDRAAEVVRRPERDREHDPERHREEQQQPDAARDQEPPGEARCAHQEAALKSVQVSSQRRSPSRPRLRYCWPFSRSSVVTLIDGSSFTRSAKASLAPLYGIG
jgi:hypothetical protein